MKSRTDLPFLLNELGLTNQGVEVGVAQGNFSKHILENWGGSLTMVDPYTFQNSLMDRSDTKEQHDSNYISARDIERLFGPRADLLKQFSVEASGIFSDGFLDFVYLDAKHDYRSVWADLTAWYPKVKSGGIFAGHDYKNSCVRKNLVQVKRAVDGFFYNKPEKVLTTTEDNLPSWYVIKS